LLAGEGCGPLGVDVGFEDEEVGPEDEAAELAGGGCGSLGDEVGPEDEAVGLLAGGSGPLGVEVDVDVKRGA
jgi:hypothetical protein